MVSELCSIKKINRTIRNLEPKLEENRMIEKMKRNLRAGDFMPIETLEISDSLIANKINPHQLKLFASASSCGAVNPVELVLFNLNSNHRISKQSKQ